MPFFIELADDKYGNRAYTNTQPRVIEADLTENKLTVLDPPDFGRPTVRAQGWIECPGPAREVTQDERETIIAIATRRNALDAQGHRDAPRWS